MVGSLFLLFSALSLLLGILALCGKGGWLVAGFFGSKQAKESFDRTKAYRIIGIMNFVESVCFAVLAYFAFFPIPVVSAKSDPMLLLGIAVAVYFLSNILLGCYLNLCCKK